MFYFHAMQRTPLFEELTGILFLITLVIAPLSFLFGQMRYNRRVAVIRALTSAEQKVIVYRRALYTRLNIWTLAATCIAVLFYLTGNGLILLLSMAYIPLTVSSIPSVLLMKEKLDLSDEDIKTMRFLKQRHKHSFTAKRDN